MKEKGKNSFCWRESGRSRLAGESRFFEKGLSTGFAARVRQLVKTIRIANNSGRVQSTIATMPAT